MIDLTPLDVRKKKEDFKKAVRGYDPNQVEAFLDLAADRLEELVREQRSLTEKVDSLREQLTHYQEREKALNEALLAAQELREEARSQAERDAAVRLREAESHAEAILLEADQAIRHSQRRLEEVRSRRGQLLRSLRGVAGRLEEFLDLEEARLEAEPDELGDLLEKLETDMSDLSLDEAEPRPRDRRLPAEPPEPAASGTPAEPAEEAGARSRGQAPAAGEGRGPRSEGAAGPQDGEGDGGTRAEPPARPAHPARVGPGEEREEGE